MMALALAIFHKTIDGKKLGFTVDQYDMNITPYSSFDYCSGYLSYLLCFVINFLLLSRHFKHWTSIYKIIENTHWENKLKKGTTELFQCLNKTNWNNVGHRNFPIELLNLYREPKYNNENLYSEICLLLGF